MIPPTEGSGSSHGSQGGENGNDDGNGDLNPSSRAQSTPMIFSFRPLMVPPMGGYLHQHNDSGALQARGGGGGDSKIDESLYHSSPSLWNSNNPDSPTTSLRRKSTQDIFGSDNNGPVPRCPTGLMVRTTRKAAPELDIDPTKVSDDVETTAFSICRSFAPFVIHSRFLMCVVVELAILGDRM